MDRRAFLQTIAATALSAGNGIRSIASPLADGSKVYLLTIGVPEYRNGIRNLPSPAKDAILFLKTLPDSQGVALLNGIQKSDDILPPTKANIMAALKAVALKVRPNDTLWFYFSGHGTAINTKSFLVPEDALINNTDSLVSVTEIREIMKKCAAKRKILVLDACCSGAVKGGPGLPKAIHWADVLEPESGLITMAACEITQSAIDTGQGSLFTLALLKGLYGESSDGKNAAVSLGGLTQYVTRTVTEYSQGRQTPVFIFRESRETQIAAAPSARPAASVQLPNLSHNTVMVREPLKPGLIVWMDEEQTDEENQVTHDSLLQPVLEGQFVEQGFPVLVREDAANFRVALHDPNANVAAKAILKNNSRFLLRGSSKCKPLPAKFAEQFNYNSVEATVIAQLINSEGQILASIRNTQTGRGNTEQRARDMAITRATAEIVRKVQPRLAEQLERKQ